MSSEDDWLLRPVTEGLIHYTDLKRTELDLADIAIMNEALDVRQENMLRMQQHPGERPHVT